MIHINKKCVLPIFMVKMADAILFSKERDNMCKK